MSSSTVIFSKDPTVSCDGGKGPLGHPKIFLDLTAKDVVFCPYCSQPFKCIQ